MKYTRMLAVGALAAATLTSAPASAVGFGIGASGNIAVASDLGACASVTFPSGQLFVGQFTAVGEVQGPGTRYGTVRGSIPIVANGYWSGCITGAFSGATAGEGKYVLQAHGAVDYVEVKQCVVNRGALTCV